MRRLIAAAVLLAACSGTAERRPAEHQSPLLRSEWRPLTPHRGYGNEIRGRMAGAAEALLSESPDGSGWGLEDLAAILGDVAPKVSWSAEKGLEDLAASARGADAYRDAGAPGIGDIALFRDQRDANGNGADDDPLTGCGIVVASDGEAFEVVTRTGGRPRRIPVCPGLPDARESGGRVVNGFARVPRRDDPRDAAYLAGRLYAGHIDIEALVSAGPSPGGDG